MKKILYWALVLPLTASMLMAGCKKDDDEIIIPPPVIPTPVDDLVLVGSGTSADADLDIKLYADQKLFVGYNKIYTVLLEKGTMKQVKSAQVTYIPMMDMVTGVTHACPTENPETTDPKDGLFEGAAIFIMPTSEMGAWRFGVHVINNANGMEGEVDIDIAVVNPADARVFSFESPVDLKKIFITLAEPSKPEVGMNDLVVMAHVKASMTSFPPIENLNIEFEPTMPSMGHGSPNNENPVHMLNGHYQGVVNFTMNGFWRLDMTIKDDMNVIIDDTHSFDVNF
jgi:hypothetical protein